ncbi:anti-sigma F factor [Thermosyntropha sp.]|uniref:anti-sigma F factor n=1 Tax=Thermosyntropha sp. TaxID=2740820 RepID=UPI0025E55C40|nr:anti-sigma F factor [Thermosyntropha sp.]MBO8158690.1 anti-sigma F factor [Thermosyntropha sp.]
MNVKNYVRFEFQSLPENISFARSCVGAFASQLDCTLDDIEEIKLVVSEAVSNSIIHGYENNPHEKVVIVVSIMDDNTLEIIIEDYGKGIEDIEKAMEPTYSTDPSRMGLGFTFMKSFMDEVDVISKPGKGTTVKLRRNFAAADKEAYA